MGHAIADYCSRLVVGFGNGWNRFWFTRTNPLTLGVLRVACGLMAFYFVASYGPDLVRWFGPDGMLPRETIRELAPFDINSGRSAFDNRPSFLFLAQSETELWVLYSVSLAVLALFTAGVFTRVSSTLALAVVMSFIHRAPVLTGQLEPILALVMIYVCLGCVFFGSNPAPLSIDRWRARRKETGGAAEARRRDPLADRSVTANFVVQLVQVHLCLVYLMMAVGKLAGPPMMDMPNVWWDGTAVWWLIARPDSRLVDLTVFHDWPKLLNVWTHAIVLFELAFAILIWNRLARPLLLVLAVPMWLSLALITGLTPFCMMMLIANLAFVAPETFAVCCGCSKGDLKSSAAATA